jgi:hypothetical protein
MSKGHEATRFDERNVHSQCRHCNQYLGGNIPAYEKAIDELYGKGYSDRLKVKAQMVVKRTTEDLRKIANFYREKVKELKKGGE